jgi:hypothetical protein
VPALCSGDIEKVCHVELRAGIRIDGVLAPVCSQLRCTNCRYVGLEVSTRHLDCCAVHLRVAEVALGLGDVDRTAAALAAAESTLDACDATTTVADSKGDGNVAVMEYHPLRIKLLELRGRLAARSTIPKDLTTAQAFFNDAIAIANRAFPRGDREHFCVTRLKAAAAHARRRAVAQPLGDRGGGSSRRIAGSALQPTGMVADHWCGRSSEMDVLETALLEPVDGVRIVALTGSHGVGKSALAHKFAQKHRHEFTGGMHWIDCANNLSLRGSIFDLCYQIGLTDFHFALADTVLAFVSAVQALQACSAEYLVCFENVNTTESMTVVQNCLTAVGTSLLGTVLILSPLVNMQQRLGPGSSVVEIALSPMRK